MITQIKKIMQERTQEKMFHINDAVTRASWKHNVETDINVLNPKNDYKVICDESNNEPLKNFVGEVHYRNDDGTITILTSEITISTNFKEIVYKEI